jgi:hypothetical protein
VLSTKALDELDHVRTKARDDMLQLLTAADKGEKSVPRRGTGPVEIATFEC